MQILKKMLKQKAVYWPRVGYNEDGTARLGQPVEIKCRWEDVQVQFVDKAGVNKTSKSRIYSDRDLTLDGVLWLGKLGDADSLSDPFANEGAHTIQKAGKLPTMNAKKFLRENYL